MSGEQGAGDRQASAGRRVLLWLSSVLAAAVLLALVVRFGRIELIPDPLVLPRPWLLVGACAVQLPYTLTRALRLRFVLDPLVSAARGERARFDWRVIQGSGMLSYPIVIMLPFRLGELSRPLLLTRAGQPGVGFAESVSAIAVERVVDGLMVVGMLFFGLAFAQLGGAGGTEASGGGETLAYVRDFGQLMALTFVIGLVALVAAAARPVLLERIVSRTIPGRLGDRAAAAAGRVAGTIAVLFEWRRGLPFVAWSLIYWGLTVCQLWLVLLACGLELGFADAAAVVSIVGLAIQLPGGPAQAGSFQIGMAAALGLLTGASEHDAASSFAALMYLLQLGGAGLLALPGLWLLARARADAPPEPPASSPTGSGLAAPAAAPGQNPASGGSTPA